MFAQVTIHTTGDDNALLIPKEALIRTGIQDRVVLALGDGHFAVLDRVTGDVDVNKVVTSLVKHLKTKAKPNVSAAKTKKVKVNNESS